MQCIKMTFIIHLSLKFHDSDLAIVFDIIFGAVNGTFMPTVGPFVIKFCSSKFSMIFLSI